MLKNLKKYSRLKKIVSRYDLEDIIVFGSSVKGKAAPSDIDICAIFKAEIDAGTLKEIQSELGDEFHVSALSVSNFFNKKHNLVQTLLFEGISIKSGAPISEVYSLDSFGLYYYNLSGLSKSDKVRLVYLLKGRKEGEGIVSQFKGYFLVDGCFVVPAEKDSEMLEILTKWNVKFKRRMVYLIR